jgi:hypothetical protein
MIGENLNWNYVELSRHTIALSLQTAKPFLKFSFFCEKHILLALTFLETSDFNEATQRSQVREGWAEVTFIRSTCLSCFSGREMSRGAMWTMRTTEDVALRVLLQHVFKLCINIVFLHLLICCIEIVQSPVFVYCFKISLLSLFLCVVNCQH